MRYFMGFLVAVGLIIVVFILLIRGLGGGGSEKPKPKQVTLRDYAATATVVQFTEDGPVIADQLHNGVRVIVGQTETRVEVYQGYQNNVIRSQSYANNQQSYEEFLSALQLLGFNKGKKDIPQTDESGYCPSGVRYLFQIVDGTDDIQRYWATSCGGVGSYAGNIPKVRLLFRQQVPDYNKITKGLNL